MKKFKELIETKIYTSNITNEEPVVEPDIDSSPIGELKELIFK